MLRYIFQRILSLIPVLFIVGIIVFLIVHLTPGNPAHIILGQDSSKESVQALEEQLGLNEPLPMQFLHWTENVLKGDLGQSVYSNEAVTTIIWSHFGPTFSLMSLSLILTLIIAIPLAILAVWQRGSWLEKVFVPVSLLGVSIPSFWLAIILVLIFAVFIPIFPVAGYTNIQAGLSQWLYHLILPSMILAIVEIGIIARMLRDSMLEAVNQDYTKTARAKGLHEYEILIKHVLRNALLPTTTIIGMIIAGLLGGTVIIETIFTIPGIGQLLIDSIYRRDYPVIQGTVLFIALIYVLVNLAIDLIYGLIDPRIRYES